METEHQKKLNHMVAIHKRMERNIDDVERALCEYREASQDLSNDDEKEITILDMLVGIIAICKVEEINFDRLVRSAKMEQLEE